MTEPGWFSTRRALAGVAAVLLAAAGLLAGCAGPMSVADRVYAGLPSSLSEAEQDALVSGAPSDDYVNVAWLDEGSRFALITFGSSSCPWVVTRVEAVDEGSLRLSLELEDAGACTDDLAPLTHELTLPPAVTERPVAVQLAYSGSDSFTEILLD